MRQLLVMSAIGALASSALADPTVSFFDDFQSGTPRSAWSSNVFVETQGPSIFTRFAGRYGNDRLVLTLPVIDPLGPRDTTEPPPDDNGGGGGGGEPFVQYALSFDLYIIDSWDGDASNFGPDHFEVRVNSDSLFNETFANQHEFQSFTRPDIGPVQLGYSGFDDSIYRAITIPFTLDPAATALIISFEGLGLQTLADESWGIDNVQIAYDIVPAPASAGLLALGGLVLGARRRR